MKKQKSYPWTEHLFKQFIHLVNKDWLIEKLKDADLENTPENNGKIQINHPYTLYKDMFGVKIETGWFEIRKILMSDALKLLNNFVEIQKHRNKIKFKVIQNLDGIVQIANAFGLEKPDETAVQGYALNKELSFFETEPFSCLILKYKDKPENIFLLYRIYFAILQDELFIIIEKSL